jgi:hypothetical protein
MEIRGSGGWWLKETGGHRGRETCRMGTERQWGKKKEAAKQETVRRTEQQENAVKMEIEKETGRMGSRDSKTRKQEAKVTMAQGLGKKGGREASRQGRHWDK